LTWGVYAGAMPAREPGAGRHPLVVGDDSRETRLDLLRRGEMNRVQRSQILRLERPGCSEDAVSKQPIPW